LNGRAVGSRIGEGNSQLDAIGSTCFKSAHNFERGLEVRISGRNKRNERRFAGFF
jgi:hypothetical protein